MPINVKLPSLPDHIGTISVKLKVDVLQYWRLAQIVNKITTQ